MSNPNRKGQAGNPVSTGMQSATYTPFVNTHFNLPHGLFLRQTILAGTTSVTIPDGINFVYAIAVGGGTTGFFPAGGWGGGGAGGVAWGWTIATSKCVVGTGGVLGNSNGNYTRYGSIIAAGSNISLTSVLGAGGASGFYSGGTNYYGMPGGAVGFTGFVPDGFIGSGGGGARNSPSNGLRGGNGGDGISGGGGGASAVFGGLDNIAGNGGSGLVGGGGGASSGSGLRVGGNGGTGLNILTGTITTAGLGTSGTNTNGGGGGGGGIAGNGSNATGANGGNGGLGGGAGGGGSTPGLGGNGILYLFY